MTLPTCEPTAEPSLSPVLRVVPDRRTHERRNIGRVHESVSSPLPPLQQSTAAEKTANRLRIFVAEFRRCLLHREKTAGTVALHERLDQIDARVRQVNRLSLRLRRAACALADDVEALRGCHD